MLGQGEMSTREVVEELFTSGLCSAVWDGVLARQETDEHLTPHELSGCAAVEIHQFTGPLTTPSC